MQETDDDLIESYLAGDTGAFRALVERYSDPLMRFLCRFVGRRDTAEDVFQDTFLQVHQSLDTFDRTRRFKPWLFTIAANKGRDALRRLQRRPAVSLSARTPGSDVEGSGSGGLVDLIQIEVPEPGARLDSEELSDKVQRAVDAIPVRLREILLLAYFQRLTYAQIADEYEIPIGTVKSRLHAAVACFAQRWQEESESEKHRESEARSRRELSG